MRKRTVHCLLTLVLTLALLCPASAAGVPTLWMEEGSGTGDVQLTLRELGDRSVNSVQLELTWNGSYPRAGFSAGGGSYGYCRVEAGGGKTTVTVYLDSLRNLNQNGTAPLGTLTLGGGYTAPGAARLTILDRSLESGEFSGREIAVRSNSGGSGSSGNSGSSGSSGGSSGGAARYDVRASGVGRGAVMVSPGRAERGERINVTVRPDSGYRLSELTAFSGETRLQLNDRGGGSFTFSMPASNVDVRAVFAAEAPAEFPFTDVKEGVWFREAVEYVYENGLMSGTGAATFGPDLATNRGMIVTILYRLAGSPAAGGSVFTDVAGGQYYAKAVTWAAANGVVSGYGDGRFGPNDPITREQMAVILQGYARLSGIDVSARADLSGYADAGKISPYAREAMGWASASGLISGTSATTLTPAGTATRAQAAVILRSFCEHVMTGG